MLEPKDIKRHESRHIVIMFRSDESEPGRIITASAHRDQVRDFQDSGWMIAPCYALEIPTPEFTDAMLRDHDSGKISLTEPSQMREEALRDSEKREVLLAKAATRACIENPDPEKVGKYLEERNYGKRS